MDDEPGALVVLERTLNRADYEVAKAVSADDGLKRFEEEPYPVVVTDINMPGRSGFELLDDVKRTRPESAVLMVTAYADLNSAVEALRRGADDYIVKPIKPDLIIRAVDRAFEKLQLREEVRYLQSQIRDQYGFETIVGASESLRATIKMAARVAPTDENILITGASGTGKEMFARAIHLSSNRRAKRFIPVNCGALPEHLIESELFGHVRGAFTSAVVSKDGLMTEGDGGTVFFDEISELPLPTQVKLLRFLEDHHVRPVGGLKETRVDVRVIAATNKNLDDEVKASRFREDLFFRLRVLEVRIPPLMERREDVPTLVKYFIEKHGQRSGRQTLDVPPEVMARLQSYDWPGNVRELENMVKHLLIMCDNPVVLCSDLPGYLREEPAEPTRREAYLSDGKSYSEIRSKVLEDFNRTILTEALDLEEWNISRAAERLGTAKSNVIRLMKRFNLNREGIEE